MGSPKAPSPPSPPSPQEAAQAALSATQAGDVYDVANAPIQGYADLYTQAMLGPARAQLQQGLINQQALQSAMAQQDIQSRVDPMAYATRQMNLKAATSRLGQLYGMDPSAFSYRQPSAYGTPTAAALPSLDTISGVPFASRLSTVTMNKSGAPSIYTPSGSGQVPGAGGAPAQYPSYLGIYG